MEKLIREDLMGEPIEGTHIGEDEIYIHLG